VSETIEQYPSVEVLQCPYDFYSAGRQGSVQRVGDSDSYLVFRHSDIDEVLRLDGSAFSAEAGREQGGLDYKGAHHIGVTDPPEHTTNRALMTQPFTPGRQRALEPQVAEIVDVLIDRFIQRGEVELIREFAFQVPALVTCMVMDLPTEGPEFDFIHQWSTQLGKADANVSPAEFTRMLDYIADLVWQRHEHPGGDIVSELVARQVERDGAIDHPLLTTLTIELLAGGVITTGQMIGSGMQLLLDNPDQYERVAADATLIPAFLEEALRMEPPVHWRQRIAKRDIVVGGVAIPEGSLLTLVYASANRDETKFPDPDTFKIDRNNVRQHLAFGKGLHFCLGAPLARTEGKVAFERLFARLTDIRYAEGKNDFRSIQSFLFRSPAELHLTFSHAAVR
jgi:cytochrome P450